MKVSAHVISVPGVLEAHVGTPVRLLMAIAALMLTASSSTAQQNFSCGYGTRGACLGFNDKVVDQDSACFSSFTCNFKGFVCKSKLDDVVDQYDALVARHNDLIRKHKELGDAAQEILDRNRRMTSDLDEVASRFKQLSTDYEAQSEQLSALRSQYLQLLAARKQTTPQPGSQQRKANQ